MSEIIKNKQYRQEKLKELIKKLHDGASVEEVQEEFKQLTESVTATEITEMEQALVDEGMPITDIQRLCDVHASVFKGSIEDIHKDAPSPPEFIEGHPINTLKAENKVIQKYMSNDVMAKLKSFVDSQSEDDRKALIESLEALLSINKHYSRKENLIFPIMEKYDITAPPQVMWGVDDEIRDKIKSTISTLKNGDANATDIHDVVNDFVKQIEEMIFKEEEIMIPMVLEVFSDQDWIDIEESSAEIGFTFIDPPKRWKIDIEESKGRQPVLKKAQAIPEDNIAMVALDSQTKIKFDAGMLTSEEINSILNTVPVDMTFVDAEDKVRYFTQGKERVFERPLTIIGRLVKNCHPPKSVNIVEGIIADLRSGKKDNEDFWLRMGDLFVYIRYFAVRNKKGEYLGVLEVTQNIKPITELDGEKRLVE